MNVGTSVSVCLQLFTIGLLVYIVLKMNTNDSIFEIETLTSLFKPIARKPETSPNPERKHSTEVVDLPADVYSECEERDRVDLYPDPEKKSLGDVESESESESDSESEHESEKDSESEHESEKDSDYLLKLTESKGDEKRTEDDAIYYESETHNDEKETPDQIVEIVPDGENPEDKDSDLNRID